MSFSYLDADLIMGGLLPDLPLPMRVEVYAETSSTNDVAWRLGQGGAPEGAVIFAESQTKGRGTRGRVWKSAAGKGLWFSILLRPAFPVEYWTRVTPALAVAVARTVEAVTGQLAGIKWTNDIHLGDRKVCGILTEAAVTGGDHFMVAGIGLNVLHAAGDFPPELEGIATSLALETGREPVREEVAAKLLNEIAQAYAASASAPGFQYLLQNFRARNVLLGRRVRVEDGQLIAEGEVTGIGEEGQLLLSGEAGAWETRSGTVTLL